MTDARMPERWLSDRRLLRLSDAAYRLHLTGLLWSVANRTDGEVANQLAERRPVHPQSGAPVRQSHLPPLESAGVVLGVDLGNAPSSAVR